MGRARAEQFYRMGSSWRLPSRSWRSWQLPARDLARCAVVVILLVWALTAPSIHDQTPAPHDGVPLAALSVAAALFARWMRQRFNVAGQAARALPVPFYTLYLASIILAGLSAALVIAALLPVLDELVAWRRGGDLQVALRKAASGMLITFAAGVCFAVTANALRPRLPQFQADLIGALIGAAAMYAGIGCAHALEWQGHGGLRPRALLDVFTTPALRFQLLLLSVCPLLPLAALVDDTMAELAWALFLVPLGAVYYLALMSVRLQQRTEELQRTVVQLGAAQRREVELTGYAALVTRAQEDERRRLARELHDDTAQALIALSRGLDTLGGRDGEPPLPDGDVRFIADLRGLAKRTLESVRQACYDLRPSVLDDLGLSAALASLAQSVTQRGLRCAFTEHGTYQPCQPEVEVTIYRVAQEALANALQHARASRAELRITYAADAITLRVHDDGRGFDYIAALRIVPGDRDQRDDATHTPSGGPDGDTAPAANALYNATYMGLGLLGMRERASLIGARVEVESGLGRGTTVLLSAPLAVERAEAPGA
jgi:signal transduction histidine kinase